MSLFKNITQYTDRFSFELFAIAILNLLIAGLFAYMNLSEFYTVAILKDISQYPFGSGDGCWYYESAELYSMVNLIFGLLFSIIIVACVWFLFNKKGLFVFLAFIMTVVLIILQLINGFIG